MMLLQDTTEYLYQQALLELRGRFKRKRATDPRGREFWAEPNFQETIFNTNDVDALDKIELSDGYVVLYSQHSPFRWTGEYIITYQIGLQHDLTTP